jgi:hypothetical protein
LIFFEEIFVVAPLKCRANFVAGIYFERPASPSVW